MRRLVVTALALTFTVASPFGVAQAQPVPGVVAGPLAFLLGFATPVTLASPTQGLEFVNLDTTVHNVASVAHGPDSNPWCSSYGYGPGACPLFRSDDLGNGGVGEVFGVDALVSGQTYAFVCTYHGGMKGTLVTLPS